MADIGRDGTTSGGKLEGFQIRPCAKSSHFTASEIPSVEDVHGMTLIISKALPAFQAMMSVQLLIVLYAHDPCPSHSCVEQGSINHVRNT